MLITGGLNLMSMEGHGTDAYCHLNRLGTHCENLPQGVASSPVSSDERDTIMAHGLFLFLFPAHSCSG